MNIYVVSQYYYPDNFRVNDIVKEWVEKGNDVRVLTGLPDYSTSKIPKEYKLFKKRKEIIDGAEVRRVTTIARRKGFFFRVLNYGSFVVSSFFYSLFSQKWDCDTIFVNQTSPVFQAIPALILKKRLKKQLVLYCYDIWPESIKAWNVSEKSFIYKIILKISKKIYNSCDKVLITSTPFKDYLINVCGVDENKIYYLPQYAEDIYNDISGVYEDNNCVDFLFAGNIGTVQDVECIIKAVSLIETDFEYKIHIVGDGSSFENCKKLAKEINADSKIIFHGRYPLAEMKRFYKMADCFLLTLRGGDFIGMTLPAKFQGYISAGKPIVAAIDGAANEIIHECDCGLCGPAGDEVMLSQNMTKIIEDFEYYKEKGNNGRKFYEQNYTKDKFMTDFQKILNK